MGGPGAVQELIPRRLRCLRIRVVSNFPSFLQGKLCRAGAVHGGQTGFQQPAGSPPRGLLVDMEEVGSGYGDTSLFFPFTLSALKCVVHAFRRGSHFFGGWGLCLFSCTFLLLFGCSDSQLLSLGSPIRSSRFQRMTFALAFHSFLAGEQLFSPLLNGAVYQRL